MIKNISNMYVDDQGVEYYEYEITDYNLVDGADSVTLEIIFEADSTERILFDVPSVNRLDTDFANLFIYNNGYKLFDVISGVIPVRKVEAENDGENEETYQFYMPR